MGKVCGFLVEWHYVYIWKFQDFSFWKQNVRIPGVYTIKLYFHIIWDDGAICYILLKIIQKSEPKKIYECLNTILFYSFVCFCSKDLYSYRYYKSQSWPVYNKKIKIKLCKIPYNNEDKTGLFFFLPFLLVFIDTGLAAKEDTSIKFQELN